MIASGIGWGQWGHRDNERVKMRNKHSWTEVEELERLMRLGYEDMAEENLREAEDAIHAQVEVIKQE